MAFDARFNGDWSHSENGSPIQLIETEGALLIRYSIQKNIVDEKWILELDGKQTVLDNSGEINLDEIPSTIHLKKESDFLRMFSLGTNFPNPFNGTTIIPFELEKTAQISLTVYDVSGRVVNELVTGEKPTGMYHIEWDGKNLLGTGGAIKKALPESTGDIILIQDADLEYSPKDFPRLMKPIVDKEADVVFGSRFIGGEMHRVLYFWHSLGNKILTFLSNVFTNLNLTDIETCYKLFRSKYIKEINLEENGFGFEPEIVAKVSKLYPPIKIFEVGVSYKGRTYHQGKKITWKDGVKAIYCIVKYNLFR